jgi:hypothetical protein
MRLHTWRYAARTFVARFTGHLDNTLCEGMILPCRRTRIITTRQRELPDSLGQLTNLRELYLGSIDITPLPDSLGQLTNLQMLDVELCFVGAREYVRLDSVSSLR